MQLIVRIHPAEIRLYRKSLERVGDLIKERLPKIPSNVKIVDSESPISSYALIELSDAALVYTSTMGLEAAAMGKKAIVSAKTHYKGKGFTTDPQTSEEYFRQIDNNPPIDSNIVMEKARRYAYIFFFDTHIPFLSVSEDKEMGNFRFNINSLDELFRGNYPEVKLLRRFPFQNKDGFISCQEILK